MRYPNGFEGMSYSEMPMSAQYAFSKLNENDADIQDFPAPPEPVVTFRDPSETGGMTELYHFFADGSLHYVSTGDNETWTDGADFFTRNIEHFEALPENHPQRLAAEYCGAINAAH